MKHAELDTLERLGTLAAVLDRHGSVVEWTRSLEQACARDLSDVRGRPLWDLVAGTDAERLRSVLAEVARDQQPRCVEASLMLPSGEPRTITWTCTGFADDALIAFGIDTNNQRSARDPSIVHDDTTAPRRTEQGLVARERELSAIYANVPGVLFHVSIDRDGEFWFASINREFLDVTGLTRDDIVGRRVRDVIPSPSRDMVLANYRDAIRTRQTVRWEELSSYPAGLRYGEVAVTPLFDASGAPIGLSGIVHDLTARKRAEMHCARKPNARASSWRRYRTSFAIHSRRFAMRSRSWNENRSAATPRGACTRSSTARSSTSFASSTT
jgi:PAS domain S-box-containing protein